MSQSNEKRKKILFLGATGFLGNGIFNGLVAFHDIIVGGRRPIEGYKKFKKIDFNQENDWKNLLSDIDLVINCVGIIEGNFQKIQVDTPKKLYQYCIEQQIEIVHISALGAEKEHPPNDFLTTKKETDSFLLEYDKARVVYPGIVIGSGGLNLSFFSELVDFPIVPLLNNKPLALVHISQLAELVEGIVNNLEAFPKQVFAISEPETLEQILENISKNRLFFIHIPPQVVQILFRFFPKMKIGIFSKDTFKMLNELDVREYEPRFSAVTELLPQTNVKPADNILHFLALLVAGLVFTMSGIWNFFHADEIFLSLCSILFGGLLFVKKIRKPIIGLQIIFLLLSLILEGLPFLNFSGYFPLSTALPMVVLSYYLYKKC